MSTTAITRCDECGKTKGDVNHWWQVWISRDRDPKRLHVQPWRAGAVLWQEGSVGSAYDPTLMDVCGVECLMKRVQKFCAEQSAVTALNMVPYGNVGGIVSR